MPVTLPSDLKERLAAGRVILFVGAGMSRPPLTGWSGLLNGILNEGLDLCTPGLKDKAQKIRALLEGKGDRDLLDAAQILRETMAHSDFFRALRKLCLGTGGSRQEIIARLPLAAILTTNFDLMIEEALPPQKRRRVLRQTQTTELIHAVRDGDFAVVHLHGDISDSESIVITAADFEAVKRNERLEHFIDVASVTHTFLFVGYGLADPDLLLFLEKVFARAERNTGPHWALIHESQLVDARRTEFSEKYGIRFIEDDRTDAPHPDLDAFLQALESVVPVPPDVEADMLRLFDEAGYRSLDRVSNQDGRLVCKALVRAGGDDLNAVIGYVHREPRDADYAALRLDGAEVCRLFCKQKPAQGPPPGIKVLTRDELLTGMMKADDYRLEVRNKHEDPGGDQVEKFYVNLRVRRTANEKDRIEDLDDFVDRWLEDNSGARKHLSILGEFGTGKSWFTRHLCYRVAGVSGRIPILLQLNKWAERFDVRSLVTDALVNEYKFPVDARVFHRLNEEGRLLLIFDGFDEMVRDANNPRTAKDNFEALATLAEPARAKILLTCRTEFFPTEEEEGEVLRTRTKKAAWIERPGFEGMYLDLFDDGQVEEALRKRGLVDLFPRLKAMDSLYGLAHRPVLLQMLLETTDQWIAQADLTMSSLYEKYTGKIMDRRPVPSPIPAADRRALIEDAAWRIQSQQDGVRAKAFDEMVKGRFDQVDSKELQKRVNDLQSQASYFRREGDVFAFTHKSFREYFVAKRLAEELLAGKLTNPDLPLTDVIASFVMEMLTGRFEPVGIPDGKGMVKVPAVPAGPFIYGDEKRKNLRLAEIGYDFWIDKNPVTNEQFLAFVQSAKPRARGGWINYKYSRISKGLEIEGGFERHPVVGVTWHGAGAYAKSIPGRRLPTEQEWEKAARGIDGRLYPWRGPFKKELCNTKEGRLGRTAESGSYLNGISPYGALDMAGNVWEWTSSDWTPGDSSKVVRGGSWYVESSLAICAFRNYSHPVYVRLGSYGVRCART